MKKQFTGVLVLNTRNGRMRVMKKMKSNALYEIPIQVNITVEVPDQKAHQLTSTIIMSEQKVTELLISELEPK